MLGISSYAYRWRHYPSSDGTAMGVPEMVEDTARLGCRLFQLADDPVLEEVDEPGLHDLAAAIATHQMVLETGTKGIEAGHLTQHLALAERLDVRLVRSMLSSPRWTPTPEEAIAELRQVIGDYERAGVVLALETYEQYSTAELVDVVAAVDSPNLGICLDPGNSAARLEHPDQILAQCAPWLVNHHVKDYGFTRAEGMIGFTLAGAPLGEGLLNLAEIDAAIAASDREVNQLLEHWMPRGDDWAQTLADEAAWVEHDLAILRSRS